MESEILAVSYRLNAQNRVENRFYKLPKYVDF